MGIGNDAGRLYTAGLPMGGCCWTVGWQGELKSQSSEEDASDSYSISSNVTRSELLP